MQTSTDITNIVNRFVQTMCGHEQYRFGRTAAHAHNIRLKEIYALVGVLSTNKMIT